MTEVSPNILERLRADTRPLHERVEKRVDLSRRCATKQVYRELLVQMFGLHAAVETVLSPEIQIREAVGAAIATFQAFEIWIGAVS